MKGLKISNACQHEKRKIKLKSEEVRGSFGLRTKNEMKTGHRAKLRLQIIMLSVGRWCKACTPVHLMYNEITSREETHSINPQKSEQSTNPNFRNSAGLRSHSLSLTPAAGVA